MRIEKNNYIVVYLFIGYGLWVYLLIGYGSPVAAAQAQTSLENLKWNLSRQHNSQIFSEESSSVMVNITNL